MSTEERTGTGMLQTLSGNTRVWLWLSIAASLLAIICKGESIIEELTDEDIPIDHCIINGTAHMF